MKPTKEWNLTNKRPADGREQAEALEEAAKLLREGGIVAFPTETVYGLGADARSTAAVERIFEAKGRPSDNPLIVHIADMAQLAELVLPYGETAARLMARFWPGPLTLVLPMRPGAVSPRVTAGLDTVAVRMPAHDTALRLIAAAGCPVAAPSANRSGRPSPTQAGHVREDLVGRIDGLVDGGPTGVGLESTVVELDGGAVRILRPGGVTAEALREVAARVIADESGSDGSAALQPQAGAGEAAQRHGRAGFPPSIGGEAAPVHERPAAAQPSSSPAARSGHAAPRSPGMKYAHYAPRGEMVLVMGDAEPVRARIQAEAAAARMRGGRTGVLTFTEHEAAFDADLVIACGSLSRLEEAAHGLYAALREFDQQRIDCIWAEGCPEQGIGVALMNRLSKAAGGRMIRV